MTPIFEVSTDKKFEEIKLISSLFSGIVATS